MIAVALAWAGPLTVRVPFPTSPLYDGPDRVCLHLDVYTGATPVESEDGRFRATCEPARDRTRVCLTRLVPDWPTRLPDLICPGQPPVRLRPVRAFDPSVDPWSGVEVVRRVDGIPAAFRVPDLPDAPGVLPGGSCGITAGLLWMRLPEAPRVQTCAIVLPDGERAVEVTLVERL